MKVLTWTHEKLQQAIDGEIIIYDGTGFEKPFRLNTQQQDRLNEARWIGYLIMNSKEIRTLPYLSLMDRLRAIKPASYKCSKVGK